MSRIPAGEQYITGAFVHEHIYGPLIGEERVGGMSDTIKARFEEEQVARGIEVPDTDDVLHTAQLALVSFVI